VALTARFSYATPFEDDKAVFYALADDPLFVRLVLVGPAVASVDASLEDVTEGAARQLSSVDTANTRTSDAPVTDQTGLQAALAQLQARGCEGTLRLLCMRPRAPWRPTAATEGTALVSGLAQRLRELVALRSLVALAIFELPRCRRHTSPTLTHVPQLCSI
jgi:hypothetical protein